MTGHGTARLLSRVYRDHGFAGSRAPVCVVTKGLVTRRFSYGFDPAEAPQDQQPGGGGKAALVQGEDVADERRSVHSRLNEHGETRYEGQTWSTWSRDAVLQPPTPEMRPSPAVLNRAAELETEAGH